MHLPLARLVFMPVIFCLLPSSSIVSPPGTMSSGRAYVLLLMYLLLFFVSPLVLRAPSTDRPETLPHGRNLAEFYNPTPKIRRALPKKNLGAKNMQNFGQFWTTSDFDR